MQPQRGLDGAEVVSPHSAGRVEAVVLEQSPAVSGDEPDCLDEVGEDRLGDEVVEVDADPARFDALAAVGDLAFELMGTVQVDAQQAMSVGARARAAATSGAVPGTPGLLTTSSTSSSSESSSDPIRTSTPAAASLPGSISA